MRLSSIMSDPRPSDERLDSIRDASRFLRVPWFPNDRCVLAAVSPDFGDDVLRLAYAQAQTTGARLVLCAVVEDNIECPTAREHLELRTRRLFPLDARIEIDCRIGDVAHEVLASIAEHDPALVVVGEATTHEGLLGRLFWPSLPTRIMRGTSAPILITRRSPGTGRILAATALGDATEPVLSAVADEVARAGGTVTVLHCLEPMVVLAAAEAPTMLVAPTDDMEAAAAQHLKQAVADAGLVGARIEVAIASPAEKILEMARAETTDLIVVATHGRSGAARLLLGSVAEEVVRDAPCSVLVVHLPAPADLDEEEPIEVDDDEPGVAYAM
jgi:nucleotide-binding universal stress UspA family protein